MKSVANIFIGILVMLIFGSCQKSVYYFQAQPIDLKVINDSGIICVKGSAVIHAGIYAVDGIDESLNFHNRKIRVYY